MDENSDRISSLHYSILCHILSFLPENYVARTSILSKRWLGLQIYAPNFYFKEFLLTRKEKFTNFVNNILLCRDNMHGDESHIHAWSSAAVRAQVQNLKT
ncbi:hypothetical protein CICLE_v10010547mg [Citrus x clementina]|uniref:F-box domain-containing protein n=1 Tax=Citrus clementina TaxID=85681 RepID=V4UGM6_CITCL|nr:hypothetical protein CICLE_v10010547mg [Citrus x clementina]GAY52505.1 hypothetical protein CUMW_142330 [Citrus unshiu]